MAVGRQARRTARVKNPGAFFPHLMEMAWSRIDTGKRAPVALDALASISIERDQEAIVKRIKVGGLGADIVFQTLSDPHLAILERNHANAVRLGHFGSNPL